MLENPVIVTGPVNQSMNKINTDNIGLCRICHSSGIKFTLHEGLPVCKDCIQGEIK